MGLWMPIADTMEALEGPCRGLVRSSGSLVDILKSPVEAWWRSHGGFVEVL